MTTYFRAGMAAAAVAGGLSLAACSAGITTAHPAGSHPPAAGRTSSASPAAATHSPSPPAGTIRLPAPIGSFPIPRGAKLVYNGSCPKQIEVEVGPVTPAQAATFYTRALPRAGYKIDGNMTSSDPSMAAGGGASFINFSGHGYTGAVITYADLGKAINGTASPDSSMSMFGQMTRNVTMIMLSPPGTSDTYQCPGN